MKPQRDLQTAVVAAITTLFTAFAGALTPLALGVASWWARAGLSVLLTAVALIFLAGLMRISRSR